MNTYNKTLLIMLLLITSSVGMFSQITYTSILDGNWNTATNWVTIPPNQGSPGTNPPLGSIIEVNTNLTVPGSLILNQEDVNITITGTGSVIVNNNLAFSGTGNPSSISGDGILTVNGDLNVNNNRGHELDVITTVLGEVDISTNTDLTVGRQLTISEDLLATGTGDIFLSAPLTANNIILNGQIANLNTTSTIDLSGNLTLLNSARLDAGGSVTVAGILDISSGADAVLNAPISIGNSATIDGNGTNVIANDGFDVVGDLSITNGGILLVTNGLSVTENTTVSDPNSFLSVTGTSTIGGTVSLVNQGDITLNGDLDVGDDLSVRNSGSEFVVNGNVNVTNNIDLNAGGDLTTDDLNVGGTVFVNGVFSDLIVNGTATIQEETTLVNGGDLTAIDLNSVDILVSGANSDLIVSGVAVVDGDLSVESSADASFGTNTIITGNLDVIGRGSDLELLTPGSQAVVRGDIFLDDSGDIFGVGTLGFNSITLGTDRSGGDGTNINCDDGSLLTIGDTFPNPLDLNNCGSGVLPIRLAFFEVSEEKGNLNFEWQTLSEENNDFFTIEYSSDLENFEVLVNHITGAGNSSSTIDYNYINDFKLPTSDNVIYFRLKQTDFDGTFTYSPIISINNNTNFLDSFILYPNPANDYVNMIFTDNNVAENTMVRIINTITLENIKTITIKSEQTRIDVSELPPGIYAIRVNGVSSVQKIIVY